jgi:hypothetical protein
MKITQNIKAGEVKSFFISYNSDWMFKLTDGSEIEFSIPDDVFRIVAQDINKKLAELDAEALEEAKAILAAEEEVVEEVEDE